MQELENALNPFRGRPILLLGSRRVDDVPDLLYISVRSFSVTDTFPSLCGFFTSFLNERREPCRQDDIQFDPPEALAFARSTLEFPGLCEITACCVAGKCSNFVSNSGFNSGFNLATCSIPLMEPGSYNVSVKFTDDQEVQAALQLEVVAPGGPPRPD